MTLKPALNACTARAKCMWFGVTIDTRFIRLGLEEPTLIVSFLQNCPTPGKDQSQFLTTSARPIGIRTKSATNQFNPIQTGGHPVHVPDKGTQFRLLPFPILTFLVMPFFFIVHCEIVSKTAPSFSKYMRISLTLYKAWLVALCPYQRHNWIFVRVDTTIA